MSMQQTLIRIGACLTGLGLVWLTAVWVIGGSVQSQYNEQLKRQQQELQPFGIVVRQREYQRDLFTSQAETVYVSEHDGRVMARLKHGIRHGPLLMDQDSLGLASLHSRLYLSAELHQAHLSLKPGQAILTASSSLSLGGQLSSRLEAPAAVWTTGNSRLAWSELSGRIEHEAGDLGPLSLSLNLASLKARRSRDGRSFDCQGLEMTYVSEPGTEKIQVERSMNLSIDSMRSERGDGHSSAQAIRLTARSFESRGMVNGTAGLSADTLRSGGKVFQEGRLDLRFANIDRSALRELRTSGSILVEDDVQGRRGRSDELRKRAFSKLLQASPEVAVPRLRARTGNGTLSLQGQAAFKSQDDRSPVSLGSAIKGLRAEVDLRMPKDVAAWVVGMVLSRKEDQGEGPKLQATVTEQGDRWLKGLSALGLINREQGAYTASARLVDGLLSLNGMEVLDLEPSS
jgi:uncharacterized protein YdgA (DUF945 family)